jgi:GTPase SAR1 family protein
MVSFGNRSVKVSVWDTAGGEKYKVLSRVYYKGAVGVLLVYDVTDKKSYEDIGSWI